MIRVRFAPSPTGLLHLGNARTALFNWLFARHMGGTFILRIEDTDVARSDPKYTRQIMEDLRWLGLDWQEGPDTGGSCGPYVQSQRMGLYKDFAEKLLKEGRVYPCYCTSEELESRRQVDRARGRPPRYDNRCRHLSEKERRAFEAEGRRPSLRFAIPERIIVVEDIVRGRCEFNTAFFGDFIIMKSDCTPSFHLAVAVDDGLMRITHVIRGEDHLTNTPLHVLLFEALGFATPLFAHLPLITWEEGLLSKRRGEGTLEGYRRLGYLPEALVNYLLLLGWSHKERREKFSLEEAIARFDIHHISRSPTAFDEKKLDWLAAQYLREADIERLTELAIPFLQESRLIPKERENLDYPGLKKVVEAVRPGLHCLSQLVEEAGFFFREPVIEMGSQPLASDKAQIVLARMLELLEEHGLLSPEALKGLAVEIKGTGFKEVMSILRLALTGKARGPELSTVVSILGIEECKKRLRNALLVKSSRGQS